MDTCSYCTYFLCQTKTNRAARLQVAFLLIAVQPAVNGSVPFDHQFSPVNIDDRISPTVGTGTSPLGVSAAGHISMLTTVSEIQSAPASAKHLTVLALPTQPAKKHKADKEGNHHKKDVKLDILKKRSPDHTCTDHEPLSTVYEILMVQKWLISYVCLHGSQVV